MAKYNEMSIGKLNSIKSFLNPVTDAAEITAINDAITAQKAARASVSKTANQALEPVSKLGFFNGIKTVDNAKYLIFDIGGTEIAVSVTKDQLANIELEEGLVRVKFNKYRHNVDTYEKNGITEFHQSSRCTKDGEVFESLDVLGTKNTTYEKEEQRAKLEELANRTKLSSLQVQLLEKQLNS